MLSSMVKTSALALILSTVAVSAFAAEGDRSKVGGAQPGASSPSAVGSSSKTGSVSEEPDNTSATYGDWSYECRTITNGDATIRNCEATQAVRTGEQNQIVSQVAVGRVSPDTPFILTILLPVNVAFPSDVKLSLEGDKSGSFVMNWTKCVPSGCFASLVLNDTSLNRLKAMTGKPMILWQSNTGQGIQFALSMRGFSQAMTQFQKNAAK